MDKNFQDHIFLPSFSKLTFDQYHFLQFHNYILLFERVFCQNLGECPNCLELLCRLCSIWDWVAISKKVKFLVPQMSLHFLFHNHLHNWWIELKLKGYIYTILKTKSLPHWPTGHFCYRGSPTYTKFTTTVSTTTVSSLCMCKWGILALVGDPLQSH